MKVDLVDVALLAGLVAALAGAYLVGSWGAVLLLAGVVVALVAGVAAWRKGAKGGHQ